MAKLVQLIQTKDRRGLARDGDPIRMVTQHWTPDGVLLWERDEWAEGQATRQAGFGKPHLEDSPKPGGNREWMRA